jgi:hypothetical protein
MSGRAGGKLKPLKVRAHFLEAGFCQLSLTGRLNIVRLTGSKEGEERGGRRRESVQREEEG